MRSGRLHRLLFLWSTLVAALAACAEGGTTTPPNDGQSREARGGPEASTYEASTPEASVGPDEDGDGHCAPGAVDPKGVCKSFDDCDDHDKLRHPGALETCANLGVDNDCDGDKDEVDEDEDGKNDLGVPCATQLPGICAQGKRGCSAGQLTCIPDVQVGAKGEECNGQDDNCDGKVDEGTVCSNGNACAGAQGCRCGSNAGCSGSQRCCTGTCLDVSTSTSSCGACGVACGSGESCAGGACQCGSTVGKVGGGKACPTSCVSGACSTCVPTQNLATQATASSSGGGSAAGYTASEMNNGLLEASCKFHWVTATSSPGGKWIQYTWPSAVTVGSIWIDTAPAGGSCSMAAGRTLAGGTLQHWSGSAWVTIGTIAGKTNDWTYSFTPVATTKLRLYDIVATSSGMASNPMIYEWRVFCQ